MISPKYANQRINRRFLLLFRFFLQHIPLKKSSVSLIETSVANFKFSQEETILYKLQVLPTGSRNIIVQVLRG